MLKDNNNVAIQIFPEIISQTIKTCETSVMCYLFLKMPSVDTELYCCEAISDIMGYSTSGASTYIQYYWS